MKKVMIPRVTLLIFTVIQVLSIVSSLSTRIQMRRTKTAMIPSVPHLLSRKAVELPAINSQTILVR